MSELISRLQLDDCVRWIHENNFKRVVIELKQEDIMHAARVSNYVNEKLNAIMIEEQKKDDQPAIYVTRSNSCSVDLVVTQHISDVDAIIHLGHVCLTKIQLKNQVCEPAIMFAFGRIEDETLSTNVVKLIKDKIVSLRENNIEDRTCILYDTGMLDIAKNVAFNLKLNELDDSCEVALLNKMCHNWYTSEYHSDFFQSKYPTHHENETRTFDQYFTKRPLPDYQHAIYIGNRLSISSILGFAGKLYKIQTSTTTPVIEGVNTTKLLYKRMALVDQIKDQEELKIGVILTNPLPDVPRVMERLHSYAKLRKHILYFITMIQTIDECKIGNFDLCDAFVIINSCTCSTILESLCFNRPIISELEFKLACGYEVEYGNVLWPGTSIHLTEDDLINRRKVSDVSLALIHTRNELLERCSQARANKWSGLDYNKATGDDDTNHEESLTVEQGLHGLASSYVSEPQIEEKEE